MAHKEMPILSARYDLKDRKFLLNQLRSGLGFINQSIAVSRHLNNAPMADKLSAAARTIQGAIVVTEDQSAWDAYLCHGSTCEAVEAETVHTAPATLPRTTTATTAIDREPIASA